MMKKSTIGILSAVALLALTLVWHSCTLDAEITTGGIYGTVTDYATGEPISNANVKLKSSGETTLTGSDGTYEFRDLKPDNYSLSLSKAEYADLDDDYVITVEAGKKAKRDVQMSKQVASLKITDMQGNDITMLDFGTDKSVTSKAFNIYNNGTLNITCQLFYNCDWIDTIVAMGTTIEPSQTRTVTVIIDRDKLSAGENRSILHIISANGSNELKILATGPGVPSVITSQVSNVTTESADCGGTVTSSGDGSVLDYGLCWSTSTIPTIDADNHLSLGSGIGSFSGTIPNLDINTTYYVRAYATNELGTAYGAVRQFTTISPYDLLPSFSFNGHTYKVAPDPHTSYDEFFSWVQADSYCQNLTVYGYSDWKMPTVEELESMYQNRLQIGGFINFHDSTYNGPSWNTRSWYHSSTQGSNGRHLKIRWDGGQRTEDFEDGYSYWLDYMGGHLNHRCHVRPIRMEN